MVTINKLCAYVSTKCNLHCKRCLLYVPYIPCQQDMPLPRIKDTFIELFKFADKINTLTLSGGETFMYPQLAEITNWLYENYKDRIGRIEMFTNGTIVPSDSLLEALQKLENYKLNTTGQHGEKIFVDNYSKDISTKIPLIKEKLEEYQLNYEIRNYTAENAHCGGWVDFGDHRKQYYDYQKEASAADWVHRCTYMRPDFRGFGITDGIMYPCTQERVIDQFQINKAVSIEKIDIFDKSSSAEEKAAWINKMLSVPYRHACDYCSGMCDSSERYIPAEQLTSDERKKIKQGARNYHEIIE